MYPPPPQARLSSQVKPPLGREDLGMSTGEGACGVWLGLMMAGVLGVCLCLGEGREGVCLRERVGIPYFLCDPIAPRPGHGEGFPQVILCMFGRRGQALSKVRQWFLGRRGSLGQEAISGQGTFLSPCAPGPGSPRPSLLLLTSVIPRAKPQVGAVCPGQPKDHSRSLL